MYPPRSPATRLKVAIAATARIKSTLIEFSYSADPSPVWAGLRETKYILPLSAISITK